ncbi:MAG: phage portal protein [Candidatus Helarchaeota archaeon]
MTITDKDKSKEYSECWVVTSKGVFSPNQIFAKEKKDEKKGVKKAKDVKSKQITDKDYLDQSGLIPLPFEVASLLKLQDNCSYFDACVKQIAKDVIGQGWTIQPIDGDKENEAERQKIEEFIAESGGDRDETFEDTLERSIIDWGVIGWWGWEISRDGDEVNGMWHVPAQTIRVHESHDKYCQIRNNKKVWFKRFGLDENINIKDGELLKESDSDKQVNEMIFYRNYYTGSDYYGAPNILPSVGSVLGLIAVRDYNLAFFENYGVPAAIVYLTGKWDKKAGKQISNFLDVEIKRTENAHKTIVMHSPEGGSMEWIPLDMKQSKKDGAFEWYKKSSSEEVLVAYKMPPYRIGIAEQGSLGGSIAPEATKIYISSVVNPLENVVNRLVTNKIIHEGLGCESYKFVLNGVDLRDKDAEVKRQQALFSMGGITPNQIRQLQGKEPYGPEGDQYFVSSSYIPIGEEAVEKREGAMIAELEGLKVKIDEVLEKK